MATSSITKNFVISGKEQVEMFVNAIEASAKNRPVHPSIDVKFIRGEAELRELMRFRKKKAEKEDKLLSFYKSNRFQQFDTRQIANTEEQHELVQLLRLL